MIHHEKHLRSSALIQDFVIGMSDGLTVPFALAAGLSGAVDAASIVITAGLAEVAAGSIAMGLGGYLAGKTEQEHYASELAREHREVKELPDHERREVEEIFGEMGLSPAMASQATNEIIKDEEKWVRFMMKMELELEEPNPKRATQSALTIGASYIAGGIVPLAPYFFTASTLEGLKWSVVVTIIFLFIFGYFKSRLTGQPPLKGGLKVMFIGMAAAGAAFAVAKLIG